MDWIPYSGSSLGLILFFVFAISAILLLFHRLFFFSRLAFSKARKGETDARTDLPVSVIICARNEDHNLPDFLPKFLNQDYPDFEVVVVDDCSSDNTPDVLREMEKKYNRLKVVTIKEDKNHHHGKKFAVMVGIKAAKNEHLLFSDADCQPSSDQWIRKMVAGFIDNKEIVLGVGGFEKKPGFLNKLIRYDAMLIALQYISYAKSGIPYMGVGRNLAYKKSLFFAQKGFATHYHLESGDDDLFVNKAARSSTTSVEISPESITRSRVKDSMGGWIKQKRRHLTTWPFYRPGHKLLLGVTTFIQYVYFISFISLIFYSLSIGVKPQEWYVLIGAYTFNWLVYLILIFRTAAKMKEADLFLFSLAGEFVLRIFYPILSLSGKFAPKPKWKKI